MKKSIVLFLFIGLAREENVYTHGNGCCAAHSQSNSEHIKDFVLDSYHYALGWYNGHAAVANSVALAGVTYFLYKKYCPVVNRCKECLEDSKNNKIE